MTLADELADIFTSKQQKAEQLEAVKHERDAVDAQEEEFMRRRGKKPSSGRQKSGIDSPVYYSSWQTSRNSLNEPLFATNMRVAEDPTLLTYTGLNELSINSSSHF